MDDVRQDKFLTSIMRFCAWTLCAATLASFCARWHWALDLFSHFVNQYIVGGIIIAAILYLLKSPRHAALCLCLSLLSFTETRLNLEHPFQFSAPTLQTGESITIVQYNHLITSLNLETAQWLKENQDQFDIIILQEASFKTEEMAQSLLKQYPHQILEGKLHTFGLVVLSKYEISTYKTHAIQSLGKQNTLIQAEIQTPKFPITLYTIHTMPPISRDATEQRQKELNIVANMIKGDPSENIILAGDFNLTPTSPYFADLLDISGLNYQAFGVFHNPTWPKANILPFLKIPIDHTLYNQNLVLIDRYAGPSFSSDHHALVSTFTTKHTKTKK